jgi:hypothetical protein
LGHYVNDCPAQATPEVAGTIPPNSLSRSRSDRESEQSWSNVLHHL